MERAVGWFVFLATALLLFGFGYYLYHTAERKGWFVIKARFHTYVKSSSGLNAGDPVYMMGFAVGEITLIHAMPPRDPHNVRIEFAIRDPYFRYIWTGGSYLKVTPAGFLNQRQLEVTRATNGYAICVTQPVTDFTNLDLLAQNVAANPGEWQLSQDVFDAESNIVFHAYDMLTPSNLPAIAALRPHSLYAYNNTINRNRIVASWDGRFHHYKIFTPDDDTAWLKAVETPAVSDQLQEMVTQAQTALPGFLALTNKIAAVLDNSAQAASNLNLTVNEARPALANFAAISGQLREAGGLMTWALGTNGNAQMQSSLTNANLLLANTDTNLAAVLVNLANLTSNLNAQVRANSNILSSVSKIVVDTDDFVQGLKRHWLLRSAFKTKDTNAFPTTLEPLPPPRMR